jgi:hypothetical protein
MAETAASESDLNGSIRIHLWTDQAASRTATRHPNKINTATRLAGPTGDIRFCR